MSWRDKAKAAKLPEATETVIMRADLAKDYDALTEQIEQAGKGNSLAGSGKAALEARREDIRQQMQDSAIQVRMRAIPRPLWAQLRDEHPPRFNDDGTMNPLDRMFGYVNSSTFKVPMVQHSIIGLDDEDVKLTDEAMADLIVAMSEGQFTALSNTAFMLNTGSVDIPFSSSVSEKITTTGNE
jgi:hypothetical protein